ncbi:MAG: ATP-binding protein [Bacteroidota bacterium]
MQSNNLMKYLCLLLPMLFGLGKVSLAQHQKIDSLRFSLLESTPDSTRFDILSELSDQYKYIDAHTSMMYAKQSLELAMKSNLPIRTIQGYNSVGYRYLETGKLIDALKYLQEGEQLSVELKDSMHWALLSNRVGLAYWRMGRNEMSIKKFHQAYALGKVAGDDELIKQALNNLGLVSIDLGRNDEAIRYFGEIEELSIKRKDRIGIAMARMNTATVLFHKKDFEKALEGYEKTLEMLIELNNYRGITISHLNIGETLMRLGRYAEAIVAVNTGLELSEKHQLLDGKAFGLAVKGMIFMRLDRPEEARTWAKQGLELNKSLGIPDRNNNFYTTLVEASERLGDFESAYHWQKMYSDERDSLFTLKRDKEIAQLEISFQTKQKDAENDLLRTERESQTLLLKQRTRLALLTGIAVLFFMIITWLLYIGRQKTKSINVLLEKKVKERTDELEEMNKRLLRSNEELKRFAFIASHDLKEPLRNMGSFLSLIKKRLSTQADKSLLEYLGFAEKSNYQMVDLVNNVLEYSRIESRPRARIERVDLNLAVGEILGMLAETIKDRNVEIYCSNLPDIYFSGSVIRSVLKNLIENGIKYNQSPRPTIHIEAQSGGGQFQLSVADNGIGISPEFHQKIFRMFVRLHSRSEYNGTGMGLSFCQKLLQNNGGRIAVESKEGEGSRFIVTIPAKIAFRDEPSADIDEGVTNPKNITTN